MCVCVCVFVCVVEILLCSFIPLLMTLNRWLLLISWMLKVHYVGILVENVLK